jgi:hypothetical protein
VTTVLLVGTGAVGAAAARQLLDTEGIDELLLAGRRPARAAELAARLGARARAVEYRPGEPLPSDIAAVATAVPSEVDAAVAATAVDAGVSFVSCTDASSAVDALYALDRGAVEAGVTLAAGCGLAPGFSDVLVAHAVNALDEADEVHVARAGVAGPASQASVRRALREPALEWHGGAWHEDRRYGPELVWLPEPFGPRECESVGSTIRALVRGLPAVRTATFRVCEPERRRVSLPGRGPEEQWGAARVVVWGRRGRVHEPIVYGVVDRLAPSAGAVLAVATAVLAGALPALRTGVGTPAGVRSLAELVAPVPFLAELAQRGLSAVAFEGVEVG